VSEKIKRALFLLLRPLVNDPTFRVMNIDLTNEETAALLRELDGLIYGDRYFLSSRIKTLKAIRAKLRPEPVRGSLPPHRNVMSDRGQLHGKGGAEDVKGQSTPQ
jgi:hypothetical protein